MKERNSGQSRKTGGSALRFLWRSGAFVASWWFTHLNYRQAHQEVAELRGEVREQMRRLSELETALAKITRETNGTALPETPAAENSDEITPERMALIAAVVTAFLGRKVKIHQARLVNPEVASPWAQQGRVFVQASHALARH